MKLLPLAFLILAGVVVVPCASALTVDEALAQAREHHPRIQAARAEALASVSEAVLAGRRTQPELEFEAESLGGEPEYTVRLQQEFPYPGRLRPVRAAARHAAEAADLAVWAAEREVENAVRRAFAEVLAEEEFLKLRRQQAEMAVAALATARHRHVAGTSSEMDVLQADMALEAAEMELAATESARRVRIAALAGLLGIEAAALDAPEGDFFRAPARAMPEGVPERHPDLRRAEARVRQAQAEAEAARKSLRSDVTLGAGVRHESENGASTWMLSAAIPLPLVVRGPHPGEPLRRRAEAIRAEAETARMALEADRAEAHAAWSAAVQQLERCRDRLIPMAERAEAIGREGYESGRRSWLEWFESRQQLAAVRQRHVEIQRAVLLAEIELSSFIIEEQESP